MLKEKKEGEPTRIAALALSLHCPSGPMKFAVYSNAIACQTTGHAPALFSCMVELSLSVELSAPVESSCLGTRNIDLSDGTGIDLRINWILSEKLKALEEVTASAATTEVENRIL